MTQTLKETRQEGLEMNCNDSFHEEEGVFGVCGEWIHQCCSVVSYWLCPYAIGTGVTVYSGRQSRQRLFNFSLYFLWSDNCWSILPWSLSQIMFFFSFSTFLMLTAFIPQCLMQASLKDLSSRLYNYLHTLLRAQGNTIPNLLFYIFSVCLGQCQIHNTCFNEYLSKNVLLISMKICIMRISFWAWYSMVLPL